MKFPIAVQNKSSTRLIARCKGETNSLSRVLELPEFLKSCGLNLADTGADSLIEITDAASTRTARVSSYFVSLLISYICSMAFLESIDHAPRLSPGYLSDSLFRICCPDSLSRCPDCSPNSSKRTN